MLPLPAVCGARTWALGRAEERARGAGLLQAVFWEEGHRREEEAEPNTMRFPAELQ